MMDRIMTNCAGEINARRRVSPDDEPIYCAAPSPTNTDDIICFGSDDETDEATKAMKIQRYEEYGRRYLQGRPLRIFSASLRGSFEDSSGWRNPWLPQPLVQRTQCPEISNPPLAASSTIVQKNAMAAGRDSGKICGKVKDLDDSMECHLPSPQSHQDLQFFDSPTPSQTRSRVESWASGIDENMLETDRFWAPHHGSIRHSGGSVAKRPAGNDWLKRRPLKKRKPDSFENVATLYASTPTPITQIKPKNTKRSMCERSAIRSTEVITPSSCPDERPTESPGSTEPQFPTLYGEDMHIVSPRVPIKSSGVPGEPLLRDMHGGEEIIKVYSDEGESKYIEAAENLCSDAPQRQESHGINGTKVIGIFQDRTDESFCYQARPLRQSTQSKLSNPTLADCGSQCIQPEASISCSYDINIFQSGLVDAGEDTDRGLEIKTSQPLGDITSKGPSSRLNIRNNIHSTPLEVDQAQNMEVYTDHCHTLSSDLYDIDKPGDIGTDLPTYDQYPSDNSALLQHYAISATDLTNSRHDAKSLNNLKDEANLEKLGRELEMPEENLETSDGGFETPEEELVNADHLEIRQDMPAEQDKRLRETKREQEGHQFVPEMKTNQSEDDLIGLNVTLDQAENKSEPAEEGTSRVDEYDQSSEELAKVEQPSSLTTTLCQPGVLEYQSTSSELTEQNPLRGAANPAIGTDILESHDIQGTEVPPIVQDQTVVAEQQSPWVPLCAFNANAGLDDCNMTMTEDRTGDSSVENTVVLPSYPVFSDYSPAVRLSQQSPWIHEITEPATTTSLKGLIGTDSPGVLNVELPENNENPEIPADQHHLPVFASSSATSHVSDRASGITCQHHPEALESIVVKEEATLSTRDIPYTPIPKIARPTTPDAEVSIRSFSNFNFSPPQPSTCPPGSSARRTILTSGKKTRLQSSAKSCRQVSFALLPHEQEGSGSQPSIKARAASPPPAALVTLEEENMDGRYRNHFELMNRRINVHKLPTLHYHRNLLPSSSQKKPQSPSLEAMANAFKEADVNQLSHAQNTIESTENDEGEIYIRIEAPEIVPQSPWQHDSQGVDDVADVLGNLTDFLDVWTVDKDIDPTMLQGVDFW